MPFVAPWSGAAPGSCFSEVRVFDTFVAIFVQAMRRRAPTQVHPISPGRRLPSGRQLSLKCILWHYRFGWHFRSIDTWHATCFLEHLETTYSRWLSRNPIRASPPATMTATQLTDFGADQSPMMRGHSAKIRTRWNNATTAKITPATRENVFASMVILPFANRITCGF
jgi:hypothetical protein